MLSMNKIQAEIWERQRSFGPFKYFLNKAKHNFIFGLFILGGFFVPQSKIGDFETVMIIAIIGFLLLLVLQAIIGWTFNEYRFKKQTPA